MNEWENNNIAIHDTQQLFLISNYQSRLQSHVLTLDVYVIKPIKYKPDKTAWKRNDVVFDWSIIKRTANR
jgi:hypothetical protein